MSNKVNVSDYRKNILEKANNAEEGPGLVHMSSIKEAVVKKKSIKMVPQILMYEPKLKDKDGRVVSKKDDILTMKFNEVDEANVAETHQEKNDPLSREI